MDDRDHALIMNKIDQILSDNMKQNKQLDKIEVLITGNGNPDNGLIVKSTKIASKVDGIISTLKIHWGLFATLISALIGVSIRVIIQ